jgi:hypothetical protein
MSLSETKEEVFVRVIDCLREIEEAIVLDGLDCLEDWLDDIREKIEEANIELDLEREKENNDETV